LAYERKPATNHHLAARDVDNLEAILRAGLKDRSVLVRQEAVMALARIGTGDDLPVLERVAATDPGISKGIDAKYPGHYPVRYAAGLAIERLARRLQQQ